MPIPSRHRRCGRSRLARAAQEQHFSAPDKGRRGVVSLIRKRELKSTSELPAALHGQCGRHGSSARIAGAAPVSGADLSQTALEYKSQRQPGRKRQADANSQIRQCNAHRSLHGSETL